MLVAPSGIVSLEVAPFKKQAPLGCQGDMHIMLWAQRSRHDVGPSYTPMHGKRQANHLADLVQHEALAHDHQAHPLLSLHSIIQA